MPNDLTELVSVRYMVADVDAAVDFYTTHLGFTVRMSAAPAFADVTRGRLRLLLSGPASSAGRPMPDGTVPIPGGWNRIHLIVGDIAAEVDGCASQASRSGTTLSRAQADSRSCWRTRPGTLSSYSNPPANSGRFTRKRTTAGFLFTEVAELGSPSGPMGSPAALGSGLTEGLRRSPGAGTSSLRLQDHLDAAVFLFLEDLVGGRGAVEVDLVGFQVHDAERVCGIFHEREQLVRPPADVALAHPELDLLVEHGQQRHGAGRAAVHPA